MNNLPIGILGIVAILAIAFLLSSNRRAIRLRVVGPAFALQAGIAFLVLYAYLDPGVLSLGGTPRAATFRGVAQGSSVVIIRSPNGGINLVRAGGSETILLNAFTLDGQSKRAMAQAGIFDFKVGATLRPTANQVDGLYTGTFEVTIQYP